MTARLAVAFIAGAVFALGLGISGMTDPNRILAFLDVTGHWDPSLVFVMAGAVAVNAIAYRVARRRRVPVLASEFAISTRREIDVRLVVGSAVFGLGWGGSGYCPGPAVVAAVASHPTTVVFVVAMVVGMCLHGVQARRALTESVSRADPAPRS